MALAKNRRSSIDNLVLIDTSKPVPEFRSFSLLSLLRLTPILQNFAASYGERPFSSLKNHLPLSFNRSEFT
jgi:hypothetical protein